MQKESDAQRAAVIIYQGRLPWAQEWILEKPHESVILYPQFRFSAAGGVKKFHLITAEPNVMSDHQLNGIGQPVKVKSAYVQI